MSALAWLNPARWLMLLAAVGALTLGYYAWADHQQGIGDARATVRWTAALEKQKGEAARVLAVERAKVAAVELALQDIKNTQELQDAGHQKTVAGLSARLRDLAGPAGRLRDPHAAGCGGGGGGTPGAVASATGDRADDAGEAFGLLSAQLSGLLRERLREADDINNAYASCRADAFAVRVAP
ncbi:hypothetical protein [Rhodoferax ferrireducens]|uniref:hypothetical protein n=1 Tax=Rhodoferax ferrireducens TaxID=192843 RepID=UPI0013004A2F|nr:hypothetical protein [Rhodoferax ferrireducens]